MRAAGTIPAALSHGIFGIAALKGIAAWVAPGYIGRMANGLGWEMRIRHWLFGGIISFGVALAGAAEAEAENGHCLDLPYKAPASSTALAALHAKVRGENLAKDEFEATAAWKERVGRSVAGLTRWMETELGGEYVLLKIPVAVKVSYDADAGLIRLISTPRCSKPCLDDYVDLAQAHDAGGRHMAVSVAKSRRDEGTYPAQNGFGAQISVTKVDAAELFVALGDRHGMSGTGKARELLSVKAAPAEARAAVGSFFVYVHGRLSEPWATTATYRDGPSLDYPFEETHHDSLLHVTPVCAVLRNEITGTAIPLDLKTGSVKPAAASKPPGPDPAAIAEKARRERTDQYRRNRGQ